MVYKDAGHILVKSETKARLNSCREIDPETGKPESWDHLINDMIDKLEASS